MTPARNAQLPLIIAATILFFVSTNAWAGPAQNQTDTSPKSLVEDRHGKFKRALNEDRGKKPDEIREEIRSILMTFVDFDAVSRRALKKYYDDLKPKQKKRYANAFKRLVQATYLKRLKPGSHYEMLFQGEPELRDGKARVRTLIKSGDSEVEVAYLLTVGEDGLWRAYDIVIDDVSMARNYRTEFYRLMKEKGFEGLVKRVEERTKEKEKAL